MNGIGRISLSNRKIRRLLNGDVECGGSKTQRIVSPIISQFQRPYAAVNSRIQPCKISQRSHTGAKDAILNRQASDRGSCGIVKSDGYRANIQRWGIVKIDQSNTHTIGRCEDKADFFSMIKATTRNRGRASIARLGKIYI